MTDSILQGIKDFFIANAAAAGLDTNGVVDVDFLGPDNVGYSIVTNPGATKEEYLGGGGSRTFPFAFQATLSTADDTARVENGGFFEQLSDWLDDQFELDNLPTLPTGKEAFRVEAQDVAYIYEQGQSDRGFYQMLCNLTYYQAP